MTTISSTYQWPLILSVYKQLQYKTNHQTELGHFSYRELRSGSDTQTVKEEHRFGHNIVDLVSYWVKDFAEKSSKLICCANAIGTANSALEKTSIEIKIPELYPNRHIASQAGRQQITKNILQGSI